MPRFKTLEEAEKYGKKNYFNPVIEKTETRNGMRYSVWDNWR